MNLSPTTEESDYVVKLCKLFSVDKENKPELETYLGRPLTCIQRYSNSSIIGYSFYRLTQMFWAIFGQSDWQLARKDLIHLIDYRKTCVRQKAIPYKREKKAKVFLTNEILTIFVNLRSGPNPYKKQLIEVRILNLDKQFENKRKKASDQIKKTQPQKQKVYKKVAEIERKLKERQLDDGALKERKKTLQKDALTEQFQEDLIALVRLYGRRFLAHDDEKRSIFKEEYLLADLEYEEDAVL